MMNILRKSLRVLTLVSCGLVIGAAGAQDATPPAQGPQQTQLVVGQEGATSGADHERTAHPGSGDERPANDNPGDPASSEPSAGDQGGASEGSWDSSSGGHHHRHNRGGDNIVSIGHDANLPADRHAEEVVAIFGSASSAGEVDSSVVAVVGDTRVSGGRVRDGVVAVVGDSYIDGSVDGDVVSVLGDVELGPHAAVKGDVVVVGGTLTRDPSATVDGDIQTIMNGTLQHFEWLRPWVRHCLLFGRPLAFSASVGWAWFLALGFLALYLLLAVAFRPTVERSVHTLETHFGQSILAAFIAVLLTPVAITLLFITVVGIAAVPFLLLMLMCAMLFGKVVMLAAIGKRLVRNTADPTHHLVLSVLIGGVIVLLLYTIPVVGFIVYNVLGLIGLGVTICTLLMMAQAARQARSGTVPPPGPTSGPSSTGPVPPGGMPPGAAGAGAAARGGVDSGFATESMAAGEGFAGMSGASNSTSAGPSPAFGAEQAQAHGAYGAGAGVPPGSVPPGGAGSAPAPDAGARAIHPYAGFWLRMGALLLDVLLVSIVLHTISRSHDFSLVILAGYGAVMWKLKSATIGGIICGCQVVRADGRPLDWTTAIVRALACFLSLVVIGLGFIWIAIDEDRQGWHDKIAGTIVIRPPKGASLL